MKMENEHKIGEIKYGHEIGRKNSMQFQWCACVGCGKERWVMMVKGKPETNKCVACCKIGGKLTHAKVFDIPPKFGDIKTAFELGLKGKKGSKSIFEEQGYLKPKPHMAVASDSQLPILL